MFECGNCEKNSPVSTREHLETDDGWWFRDLPDGDVFVLCPACVARLLPEAAKAI